MSNNKEFWDKIDPPKKQIVSFFSHPVFDKIDNGAKVYKLVDYVRMHVQGSNDSVSRAASPEDINLHQVEYQGFKKHQEMGLTKLDVLCDKAIEKSLNELGIYSLDQLSQCESLPIYNNLINKAKSILEVKNATNTNRQEQLNHGFSEVQERSWTNSNREVRSESQEGSRKDKQTKGGREKEGRESSGEDFSREGSGKAKSEAREGRKEKVMPFKPLNFTIEYNL